VLIRHGSVLLPGCIYCGHPGGDNIDDLKVPCLGAQGIADITFEIRPLLKISGEINLMEGGTYSPPINRAIVPAESNEPRW